MSKFAILTFFTFLPKSLDTDHHSSVSLLFMLTREFRISAHDNQPPQTVFNIYSTDSLSII